jgi:type IV pilus assembly protein PilM
MLEFLNLKTEAFGLDISDLSLKVIKLKKRGKFFSLASFVEVEIKPGIVCNGEINDEQSLSKIVKDALSGIKGEKFKTKYAVVSLPEEKSFLQVIQMPIMKEEELEKAIFFDAENYVPMPIDQVYLDYQIIPSSAGASDHMDVLIAAIPKKNVDSYLSCLKLAGVKPLVFEIESQAISRCLIKNENSQSPILLIDLGATRTSFIVFSGNSLRFTTSISVSSHNFTEAISHNLGVSEQEAEKLKRKYGLEEKIKLKIGNGTTMLKERGEIFESLIPSLTDFEEQIKKYLDYYQAHNFHDHLKGAGKKIERILLSGGGANLKGLANFLSLELKLPVELANPWINILPEKLKEVPDLPFERSLSFTTALGLAIRGLDDKSHKY